MTSFTAGFPRLNLPNADLKIRKNASGFDVYDAVRNRWVALTPEEYVRQNFVEWLVNSCSYPRGRIANEITIELNGTRRRCDTIIYNRNGNPVVVVEYKAPNVSLTTAVFEQIARYNIVLGTSWIIVSNGLKHIVCSLHPTENPAYRFHPTIPAYNSLE